MFTGIIEEEGILQRIDRAGEGYSLRVSCKKVLEDTKLGDSIATNGICLTVKALGADYFEADMMKKTVEMTSFKNLRTGDKINLERALTPTSRMGGHFVSGHIDGTGRLVSVRLKKNDTVLEFSTDRDIIKFIIAQGSIAIDGVSLTVSELTSSTFSVSLIPTTLAETRLDRLKTGDIVNLETDVLGKYVYRFLQEDTSDDRLMDKLIKNGFI